MSLGHGQLGLLERQRTFKDLRLDPEADRRPFFELKLGKALTGWTASGSNFVRSTTAAELTYAGVIRPIVGAESLIHPRPLVQVERVADLVAGTWFYDHDALVSGGSTDLYVRLPTATDPDDITAGLEVHLLFACSSGNDSGKPEVHPVLGPEKGTNADFETFAAGLFTGWTEYNTGGGTGLDVQQETASPYRGSSAAKITGTAIAAGNLGGQYQEKLAVQGAIYRVAGRYRTPLTGNSSDVQVWLSVGRAAATEWMQSDGRNSTTTEGFPLANTQGEWRSFSFDFRWSGATTTALRYGVLLKNTAAGTRAGTVDVDDVTFKRVYRYARFDPVLDAQSVPEMEIRAQSINFGLTTIGIGSIALVDGTGDLTKAFAQLHLLHKPALLSVGGSFRNGDEIQRDDWWPAFAGVTRRPMFEDGRITFELDTAHTLARIDVPPNGHRVAESATMARSQEGLPKPLVFGTPWDTGGATFQHIIPGVRVALHATKLYGEYEYLDPFVPVATGVDVDLPASYSIKVFPNKDLADRNLQGYVITDSTLDFDVTNNKTRWRILRDIRNYRYDREGLDVGTGSVFSFGIGSFTVTTGVNDKIDVSAPAGAEQTVTLTAGNYSGATLATHVEGLLDGIAALGDFTVTYSATTGKFTITYNGGGNIELKTGTGTNKATSALILLMGYLEAPHEIPLGGAPGTDPIVEATNKDYTGRTNYSSSFPVFGVTVYTASLDIAGPAYKVAADLQAAMRTAAGGIATIDVTYSETTHKFTVAYTGAHLVFIILVEGQPATARATGLITARAPQKRSWALLGYDTRDDKTGATSYVGDLATFTDADTDHVIRFPGGGYRDDATGSIAGVANAAINTPAAIAAWILRYVLNVPAASIDVASFSAARTANLNDFAIQFRQIRAGDAYGVLGELCQAGLFDLNVDGLGRWTCKRYVAGSTGATEIFERDLLPPWRMWQEPAAVYREVRVHGDWNPSLSRYMTYLPATVSLTILDPYIPIKHGAEGILHVWAAIERQYIASGNLLLANYYGRLIGKIPRVVEFSCRGKLLDRLIGDKVKLTRDRAFDPNGTLAGGVFRIVGLRHDFLTGISTCTAVEDVVFLT